MPTQKNNRNKQRVVWNSQERDKASEWGQLLFRLHNNKKIFLIFESNVGLVKTLSSNHLEH